jgi:anthranilate phosphoribosyltransferase
MWPAAIPQTMAIVCGLQMTLMTEPMSPDAAGKPRDDDDLPVAVRSVLTGISVGERIHATGLADAFAACVSLRPPIRDVVLGSLMTAVMARGPLAQDVVALLRSALEVDGREPPKTVSSDQPVILLAGSGKKGLRTFNVSTPAALVAAAAGARVIKVGSAATSSALGSRDLVRAIGLAERQTADEVRADLAACGFSFVAIEPEIPILDRIYGGRFHAPNPFSFGLAPLASPVRGDITVFGLSHPRVDVAAQVLSQFDMPQVDVLATRLPGGRYLDEIGPVGETRWCRVRDGQIGPVQTELAGRLVNVVPTAELPTPRSPEEAVHQAHNLLSGRGIDSHCVLVCLNAAHLLVLSGVVDSTSEGIETAEDVLKSGEALANAAGAADRSA